MSLIDTYNQGYNIILAQSAPMTFSPTMENAERFAIAFPEEWNKFGQIIAVIAMLAWIGYAAWNYLNPKGQGRGMQRLGGFFPLVLAALAAGLFWDLNNLTMVANFALNVGISLWTLLKQLLV